MMWQSQGGSCQTWTEAGIKLFDLQNCELIKSLFFIAYLFHYLFHYSNRKWPNTFLSNTLEYSDWQSQPGPCHLRAYITVWQVSQTMKRVMYHSSVRSYSGQILSDCSTKILKLDSFFPFDSGSSSGKVVHCHNPVPPPWSTTSRGESMWLKSDTARSSWHTEVNGAWIERVWNNMV